MLTFSLIAQTNASFRLYPGSGPKKTEIKKRVFFKDKNENFFSGAPKQLPMTKDINVVTKKLISYSPNPFSYLGNQQTVLSSNPDLNLITFTHLKSPFNIIPGSTTNASGVIQTSFSVDGGNVWDTLLVPYRDSINALNAGRYPSGVIYNPTGNTSVSNAYAVVCGPKLTNDSLPWAGNYFASESFSHANNNMQINVGPQDSTFARNYLQSCDGGKFHTIGTHTSLNSDSSAFTSINTFKYDGNWNSTTNSVDWNVSTISPPFSTAANGNINGNANPAYAWSKDGQVGYLVFTGASNTAPDPKAYAPIVYKTINGGTTWSLMPSFDFTTLTDIDTTLIGTISNPAIKHVHFSDPSDAVVDANDNLHIVGFIRSGYYDNPDSLAYYYSYEKIEGYMFDVFTTQTGGWNALYLDTQYGKDLSAADDIQWGLGWDNRLSVSKSPDATKLFYIWTDTDTVNNEVDHLNRYPDILTLGYDVNVQTWTNNHSACNLTKGTYYDGANLFMCAGDWAFGNFGTFRLNLSTEVLGVTSADPAGHYYVLNANFPTCSVGVNEIFDNSVFSVSQNYPNPANGNTAIDVNLKKSCKISLVIRNLIGQIVYEVPEKNVNAGVHSLTIDANRLNSGIYFITINADNSFIIKKMIVE